MPTQCCADASCSSNHAGGDIWKACQEGLLENVKAAVGVSAELVNKPGPVDQVPPLHWAALNGHLEICRFLLESGASINQLGGDQWSTALHWAACRGQMDVVILLIQRGADYAGLRDQQGYLPMHIAAQHGQTYVALYLVAIAGPTTVNVHDLHERTPLIWAAYRGHDEMVGALLAEGAAVEHKDRSGSTALHWASIKGNAQIMKLLLAAGASPFDKDGDGKSAVDHAKEKRWPWLETVLKCTGHANATRPQMMDPESGLLLEPLPSKKPQWLPERLFRPLINEPGLQFVLGRVVPPIITFICVYLVCYAINPVIGIALALLTLTGTRVLYYVMQPNSTQQDTKIPVLNTFHYTLLAVVTCVDVVNFIPSGTSSKMTEAAILFLTGLTACLLYQSQSADAGSIGKPKDDDERRSAILELADKNNFNRRTYCLTCRAGKPVRSKHCRFCKRCIAKFDHHCPWTNNCIGAGNHRVFTLYLLSTTTGALLYVKASFNYLSSLIQSKEPAWSSYKTIQCFQWIAHAYQAAPLSTLFGYIVLSAGFGLCILTTIQLWNIARDRTTNENANSLRLQYLHSGGPGIEDLGVVGNCFKFFEGKQDPSWYTVAHEEADTRIATTIKYVGMASTCQPPMAPMASLAALAPMAPVANAPQPNSGSQ